VHTIIKLVGPISLMKS